MKRPQGTYTFEHRHSQFTYCSGETHDIIECSCGLRSCAYLGRTLYFSCVEKDREVIYPIHSGRHRIFFIHDAALRLSRTAATERQYGLIQTVLTPDRQCVCVCVVQSASPDSHRAVPTSIFNIA